MEGFNNPLVSVCMITYKHEKYIEEAINGVFSQEVNFPIEFIIANDNSPDETENIINRIIQNHPSGKMIRYIRHSENIGAIPNFYFALKQARGKYIAICEGDDYWINSKKLTMQINFLENNPDFSASFHDVLMKNKDVKISFTNNRKNEINETVFFKDLIQATWLIPTCSFVFRKSKMILPPFVENFRHGDFPLFCTILLNSKAYFFKEPMGVYRRDNPASITNTIQTFGHLSISAEYVQILTWLNKFANENDQQYIEERIYKEIKGIKKQINIYKNSGLNKLYLKLTRFLPIK